MKTQTGAYAQSKTDTSSKKYGPKQQVFAQGDAATGIYEVMTGCVKLMRCLSDGRQQIIGFFFTGDVIGLTAGKTYSYSAVTVTPTKIRFNKKTDVLRRMMQEDALGENLVQLASDELAAAHDQMTLLGCKRPLEKVASFIVAMSRKAPNREQVNREVYLPMPQTDMGGYLGLALETVSRSFSALKRQGVISSVDRHFFRIDDLEALLDYADTSATDWESASTAVTTHQTSEPHSF
ncbi:MAG: helix-turn-helix domain-containing protein [Rhodospirillaceae bacterium]